MGYLYIFLTLILTVYGQLILKWRLNYYTEFPDGFFDKLIFVVKLLVDPYIFSSFFSAFLASLTWMLSLKEFELSKAYPFMSLSFVFVMIIGFFFLKETVSIPKIIGCFLIVTGIVIISKAA